MAGLIRWPVTMTPNGVATCPPDATAAQQVALMLATRPGERPDAPTFGLAADLGALAVSADGVTAAIQAFLPDITGEATAIYQTDPNGQAYVEVTVT